MRRGLASVARGQAAAIVRRVVGRTAAGNPRSDVYLIYRARNATLVAQVTQPARERDWPVHMWALDEVDPLLAAHTIGSGPGAKFDLLNEMMVLRPPVCSAVVVADDDIRFHRGDIVQFRRLMAATALDIAQPAHASPANACHAITVRRPHTLARVTGFVEVGPMFGFNQKAMARLLPFPSDAGMGWGLEFQWAADEGRHRIGIIDATTVDHLAPPSSNYSMDDELKAMADFLARHRLPETTWRGSELASWPALRLRPPREWLAAAIPGVPYPVGGEG